MMDAPKERIALKIVALAIDAWRAGKVGEIVAFVTIRDAQRSWTRAIARRRSDCLQIEKRPQEDEIAEAWRTRFAAVQWAAHGVANPLAGYQDGTVLLVGGPAPAARPIVESRDGERRPTDRRSLAPHPRDSCPCPPQLDPGTRTGSTTSIRR